jgi:hypothetical protein
VSEQSEVEILLEALRENYEHFRHVENERLWFTNIYAIIVGAILTFFKEGRIEGRIFVYSMIFLIILSTLGLLMSLRLRADVQDFQDKIIAIATKLKVRDLCGLGAQKGFTVYFKLRNIFIFFYGCMLIFLVVLLMTSLSCLWSPLN